jgi:hypothetical protein
VPQSQIDADLVRVAWGLRTDTGAGAVGGIVSEICGEHSFNGQPARGGTPTVLISSASEYLCVVELGADAESIEVAPVTEGAVALLAGSLDENPGPRNVSRSTRGACVPSICEASTVGDKGAHWSWSKTDSYEGGER